MEDESGKRAHVGEDVTRGSGIFAAVKPRSELTAWHQQIDVICSHEILGHVDDRRHQRHFTVMVRRFLSHRT